jgi:NitT/TauT family transport system substrate-binding protein
MTFSVVAACAPAPTPTAAPPTAAATAAPASTATPRPVAITFNWTAVSGASSGLWTATEAGYFKDESIDIKLVNVASSARATAVLLSKEVQFTHLDGQVLVDADLGGANLRMIYGINNRLVFSVMTKPEIKKPEDLKGKKIGITSLGSSTHTAALQALKVWGMTDKDVSFTLLTEVPSILLGLIANQVDAGVVSPPTNTRAKAAGYTELINIAKEGPEWPSLGIGVTADYLQANPDVALRVVRAYSRGVQRFKSDKAFALKTLQKYLQVDDQAVLEDTWQQYSVYLVEVPYPAGFQNTIDFVAQTNEKAKGAKPADFVDTSIVKQFDDQGFYKKLYNK